MVANIVLFALCFTILSSKEVNTLGALLYKLIDHATKVKVMHQCHLEVFEHEFHLQITFFEVIVPLWLLTLKDFLGYVNILLVFGETILVWGFDVLMEDLSSLSLISELNLTAVLEQGLGPAKLVSVVADVLD